MPSKEYFRNLARMSRRVARNMIDPAIAQRLEAIGHEYDQQAELAPDSDAANDLPPPGARAPGNDEHT